MSRKSEQASDSPDSWIFLPAGQEPIFGIFIPSAGEPQFTVFWKAAVTRTNLRDIITTAGTLFENYEGDSLSAILTSFGHSKTSVSDSVGAIADLLAEHARDPEVDGLPTAYRIVVKKDIYSLILWANVDDRRELTLAQGGENIGICVQPPSMFGPARQLIASAVNATLEVQLERLSQLLDSVQEDIFGV